jgi:hypothetical protein
VNQGKSHNPNKPNNNKNKGKQHAYNAEETDEFVFTIIEEVSDPGLQIPAPDKANTDLQMDAHDQSDHCLLNLAQVLDDLISTQPPGRLHETTKQKKAQEHSPSMRGEPMNESIYAAVENNEHQQPLSSWIINTASTCHIGNKTEFFKKFQLHSGQVLGMGRHTQIQGIGDIQLHLQHSENPCSTKPLLKLLKLTLKEA